MQVLVVSCRIKIKNKKVSKRGVYKLLRTVFIAIYVILLLTLSIPYLLISKMFKILSMGKLYNKLLERFIIFFGKSVIVLAGIKVKVNGAQNIPHRNVLYVGNHQSLVDIPLMLGFIPGIKSFIAKKETAKIPIISWWMKEINCVFLDRHNIRQGMKDMAKAKEFLQGGSSMVIYPEGTRSRSDEMGEFKKGSLKIAIQAGVPIVPVAISGSYLAYEKDKVIRKANITMEIGEPIYPDTLSSEEQKEISEIAYERVKSLLSKTQKF